MMTVFNRSSCYVGFDLEEFSRVRELLSRNGIPYKCKMRSESGPYAPQGAVQGNAELGGAAGLMVEYEIFVYKQDLAKAQHLIKTSHSF
ncbi:MAG TPA: hypothetical protein IAC74_00630 [Candidatus Aphodoplasma excrementigallinarum]|uniref:DUF2007 domain-containing protein n=1 Tax=Candidatus Aphodoplasma excrementigallinarum TaxID=2840673 RepID=A0A9D1SYU2_9FIRM|nr:hypothetical protein [Candidatus Aphodoplasma excrementigallinarum]